MVVLALMPFKHPKQMARIKQMHLIKWNLRGPRNQKAIKNNKKYLIKQRKVAKQKNRRLSNQLPQSRLSPLLAPPDYGFEATRKTLQTVLKLDIVCT